MKNMSDRSGFGGSVGAFVVVGTLLVLAIGSFTYYHQRSNHAETKSNLAVGASSSAAPQESIATAQTAQPAETRLYIKEWDVQLPLASNVTDAYYVVSTSTHDPGTGQPNTLWLGLSSLNSTGCDVSRVNSVAAATPVGALIRVAANETDPVSGALYSQKYPNGVLIGDYYYAFAPWKNKSCASKATLQGIDSAFASAAKTIVSAKPPTN